MDEDWKERLLEDFRDWLEQEPEEALAHVPEPEVECDLHTLFSELAALRQEVRLQSREQARLRRELEQARAGYERAARSAGRTEEDLAAFEGRVRAAAEVATLTPFLDVRDALVRGGRAAVGLASSRWRLRRVPGIEAVVEGYDMAVERFDRVLSALGVEVVCAEDRPFDPASMRATETRRIRGVQDQQVVEELRTGFTRRGELLRPAEVVVNRGIDESRRE